VAIGLAGAAPSLARTINVPEDSRTISSALASAEYGDIVVLAAGVYTEHSLVLNSGVSLIGHTGNPEDVVIDAESRGRVLLCESVDTDVVIGGITLRGGFADGPTAYERSGGAIFFSHSEPLVANCIIRENRATGSGGALRITSGSPHVMNCTFVGNQAYRGGGAVDLSVDCEPVFDYCVFADNRAAWGGAASVRAASRPSFNNCEFTNNVASSTHGYGGAIYCDYVSAPSLNYSILRSNDARFGGATAAFEQTVLLLDNCTAVGNSATGRGQAMYCLDATPSIKRTVIAFHPGQPVVCEGTSNPLAAFTNIYGNADEDWVGRLSDQRSAQGNFSADPLFCSEGPEWRDFHLHDESPCLPENNDNGFLIGALGAGCSAMAVRLVFFDIQIVLAGADVVWEVQDAAPDQDYRVDARRDSDGSSWTVPFDEENSNSFRAVDRSEEVHLGGEVTYTVLTRSGGEPWSVLAEETVTLLLGQQKLKIGEAWPNPFNPATKLNFLVARTTQIRIAIHDIAGRVVALLADEPFAPGNHTVEWRGTSTDGRPLPSGTYFMLFEAEEFRQTRKLTLLK
jgi:predicted outer membrane repeat protein